MQIIYIRSDRPVNCFEHAIRISINIVVGKSEHTISQCVQGSVASFVTTAVGVKAVLVSVNFNDDARTAAFEVDDVTGNWRLSTKMKSERPQFAQSHPELDLLARHGFSKIASDLVWQRITSHQSGCTRILLM